MNHMWASVDIVIKMLIEWFLKNFKKVESGVEGERKLG